MCDGLKFHQNAFLATRTPLGSLQHSPNPIPGLRGPTVLLRKWSTSKGRKRREEMKGSENREGYGLAFLCFFFLQIIDHWAYRTASQNGCTYILDFCHITPLTIHRPIVGNFWTFIKETVYGWLSAFRF